MHCILLLKFHRFASHTTTIFTNLSGLVGDRKSYFLDTLIGLSAPSFNIKNISIKLRVWNHEQKTITYTHPCYVSDLQCLPWSSALGHFSQRMVEVCPGVPLSVASGTECAQSSGTWTQISGMTHCWLVSQLLLIYWWGERKRKWDFAVKQVKIFVRSSKITK